MVGVTIRDLVVRYGDSGAAVDGISLAVEPGELFLLVGPSGCGKTTVLRSVAGFVQPQAGSIHFGAEEVTHVPAHARQAGMVFQSFALWPHMTVAQNVGFGLQQQRFPRAEIATRVDAALTSTQMQGFGSRRIDQLSGGEQQRVALARALVVRPRCLLLDEPLASLDARLRRSMREEIRRICKSFELTAIYVTHDQKEALAIADRMAVMEKGRILQVGTPSEIYRRPRSRAVAAFVGDTNLFEAQVVAAADHDTVRLQGPWGPLVAAATPRARDDGFAPAIGERVWVSIRPECCRLVVGRPTASGVNVVRGRWSGSVYLGEIAEHRLQVAAQGLSVFEMNPAFSVAANASGDERQDGAGPGGAETGEITIEIDPSDVVLLPFDSLAMAPHQTAARNPEGETSMTGLP